MNEPSLSSEEFRRYQRQIALPGLGTEGQLRLRQARVLVVGAGGLGAPVLLYLAAAGVGTLGIVDFDVVEESNLHRQVLFTPADVGRSKVEAAIEKLSALNHDVQFIPHPEKLTRHNAMDLISQYDIVADGTDNFPTRYLVNDACVLCGKVNVFASLFRYEGQVSVFNLPDAEGKRGPHYRDLFPQPPPPESVMDCAEGGVLGALPGIIGAMQAVEVIKVIAGIGEPLSGKLFVWDARTFQSSLMQFAADPDTPAIEALIDYEAFCGVNTNAESEISVETFIQLKQSHSIAMLIDIREAHEREMMSVEAVALSLDEIPARMNDWPREGEIVILCQTGTRSLQLVKWLREKTGRKNFVSLKGGVNEWLARTVQ